jgi:hypothetical protein
VIRAFFLTIAGVRQVNPTTISVFDLSPSGKLQLVEDLWDDLAATPRLSQSMIGTKKSWFEERRT